MDDQEENKLKIQKGSKSITRKSHLTNQSVVHTGEMKFPCATCGKQFGWESNLVKHMVVHTGVTAHQCLKCGKSFKWRSFLREHDIVHTGIKKFPCTICNKSFAWKTSWSRHMKNHAALQSAKKKYECPQCGKKFARSSGLSRHKNKQSTCSKMGNIELQDKTSNNATASCKNPENLQQKITDDLSALKCSVGRDEPYFSEHQSKTNDDHEYNLQNPQRTTENPTARTNKVDCYANVIASTQQKSAANLAIFKCWVCGDEPGFKSGMVDQFQPQNMGFRYMCPRCDEHLESASNLGDYFKTFNNISKLVEDIKTVKKEPDEN